MANTARATLAAVPTALRRVIAIIRVSEEGGRGEQLLSPELQLTAIEREAPRRGWKVVDVVYAIDKSGSQRKSAWWPTLTAQIVRVEAGDVDGVVAWKYSRFARQRFKWAEALERIDVANGILESATEELDASTSAGRFQRGVLGEVNAFQADQISDSWRETHQNRLDRGLPINGRPRFGYVYSRETGFTPGPISGPVLAEAYRRYITGDSFYTLVAWLRTTGVRPADYGKASTGVWTDTTLRRVLDSGFGAGLLNKHDPECRCKNPSIGRCSRKIYLPGAHEPVIDAATWTRYQDARAERGRPQAARAERSQYLLVGLATCMYPLEDGTGCGSHTYYRKSAGREQTAKIYCLDAKSKQKHTGGVASARYVEEDVMAELRDMADHVEEAVAKAAAAEADRGTELAALDGQIAAAAAELDRQNRRFMRDLISEEVWPSIKAELEENLATLRRKDDRLRSASAEVPEVVAAQALEDWDTLAIEHQRAILRRLFERVEIVPGHLKPVEGSKTGRRRGNVRVIRRSR